MSCLLSVISGLLSSVATGLDWCMCPVGLVLETQSWGYWQAGLLDVQRARRGGVMLEIHCTGRLDYWMCGTDLLCWKGGGDGGRVEDGIYDKGR